jgi:hypothetical protein
MQNAHKELYSEIKKSRQKARFSDEAQNLYTAHK